MLRCSDGTLYIGETADLERRLKRHADGSACTYTASRRPVALVYSASFTNAADALYRERQLKGWTRAKKEALIAGDFERLRTLARRRPRSPHF
jgi:predicted GIY-YIG superfamily endonuclease